MPHADHRYPASPSIASIRASPHRAPPSLSPSCCRSRSEEVSISSDYLEMLHANHEDWLQHGRNLSEVHRESGGGLPNMSGRCWEGEGGARCSATGDLSGSAKAGHACV